ncbi:Hypothetical predicted protein [Paramuricea clavata]|nr:Hypothetical predicted protein [Paramuricea clavata]
MAEAEGASSVNIQNSPGGNKAILRIKRKRSADPADILLVSHAFKKAFTDEDHKLSSDEHKSVQRVFRLAGTVSKKNDETISQEILTKLSSSDRHKSKVKVNTRNELTVDAINAKLRETKKLARQTSRYKVVSKHRNDVEDDDEDTDEVDAAMQEMMKLYQLYDVVLDEAQSR